MMKGTSIGIAAVIGLVLWPAAAGAITVSVTARDDNSEGIQSEDMDEVNLIDCTEGVEITFTVDLGTTTSTNGRELYLYSGTSCDDSPEGCELIGDPQPPSDTVFTVQADELFGGCSADATANVWVGLLEEENQPVEEDGTGGIWSAESITIHLDVTPPTAEPEGLSARIGTNKVTVHWDAVSDDDVAGFLLVYWDGTASTVDADTDADAGADLDAGSLPDAGAEIAGDIVAYAESDAGIDSSESCSIEGGFTAGGDFDTSLISGFEKSSSGDATSLTIDGLENGTQYKFAVVSLDAAANPSAFSEVICATPEKIPGLSDVYEEAGGEGDGNYCFIATAAFGSYDHPVVKVLRAFRDGFLAKLPLGDSAIAAYYAVGPTLASAIEGHEALRSAVADGLFVFSGTAATLTAVGPTAFGFALAMCLLAGLVIGLALPRRRRGA